MYEFFSNYLASRTGLHAVFILAAVEFIAQRVYETINAKDDNNDLKRCMYPFKVTNKIENAYSIF